MKTGIEVHPLNAKGKYYIDQNDCTCCAACEFVAPQFFRYSEDDGVYYVDKQPEEHDEYNLCAEAMMSCPVEAIHDDGEL